MREMNEGWIINISSEVSTELCKNEGAYGVSKVGLNRLTEEIDIENRDYNIHTAAICPGWVNTELSMDPALANVKEEDIQVAWVPGAFEIPLIASKMAKSGKYDAVICVGAVIRGNTSHYDYVCNEVSKGIASVSLETGVPVLFGVLTTENIEQAIERAGTKAGNKGYDCALSAIEMVNLIKEFEA